MMQFDMATDGGTILLYRFGDYGCDDYYLWMQKCWEDIFGIEPFLSEDNFMEVEPVTIEGVECERYAYIGEDGDTLAYVVEGIGFDSRDMGDLLTPFTRRPDPTADYQEWCGLCHVVKDGKVIYKGMRYSPNNMTGIDEVVANKTRRLLDDRPLRQIHAGPGLRPDDHRPDPEPGHPVQYGPVRRYRVSHLPERSNHLRF